MSKAGYEDEQKMIDNTNDLEPIFYSYKLTC